MANVRDIDVLVDMTTSPWEGQRVKVTNDGSTNTIAGA
jgi:hypothetical protein